MSRRSLSRSNRNTTRASTQVASEVVPATAAALSCCRCRSLQAGAGAGAYVCPRWRSPSLWSITHRNHKCCKSILRSLQRCSLFVTSAGRKDSLLLRVASNEEEVQLSHRFSNSSVTGNSDTTTSNSYLQLTNHVPDFYADKSVCSQKPMCRHTALV